MSYSIENANDYFDARLWTGVWDNADDITRNQALTLAEIHIEVMPVVDELTDDEIERAIYEQALFLLRIGEEGEKRSDLQAQGVKSVDINQSVSETYDFKGITYCPFIKSIIEKSDVKDKGEWEYSIGDLV